MSERFEDHSVASHLESKIAEIESDNEILEELIVTASPITRALGAVGLGQLPRYIEQRTYNRLLAFDLKVKTGHLPWELPDLT